jgi:hypothetical protein
MIKHPCFKGILGFMDTIFLFIEFFKVRRRKTDKIYVLLWEFVQFEVDDTRGVAIVFEAVMIDEVDDVMKTQQLLLKCFIINIHYIR